MYISTGFLFVEAKSILGMKMFPLPLLDGGIIGSL